MTTLPNMSIVLPDVGGDVDAWGTKLNAALSLIDPHDHTSGKGVLITTAAINIDGDLSFAGHGATVLGRAAFTAITAPTTGFRTLFVNSADNELYWRTNAGTNVKLTSGASINVSLVGGIVGDYATVGAEVAYSDADDRYTFKQQGSPKPWAGLASGAVRIFDTGTTVANGILIRSPSLLVAPYEIQLPSTLPAAENILVINQFGVMNASNNIFADIHIGNIFVTNIKPEAGNTNFTGTVTMAQTLGVTGAITATAGITLAINQSITASGTGKLKHGNFRVTKAVLQTMFNIASGGPVSFTAGVPGATVAANTVTYTPLPDVDSKARIVGYGLRVTVTGNGAAYELSEAQSGTGFVDLSETIAKTAALNPEKTLGTPRSYSSDKPLHVKITTVAGDTVTPAAVYLIYDSV